jgi:hypothetical protein
MTTTDGLPFVLFPEGLHIDPSAALEKGCRVAVFWDSHFIVSGRLLRRPHPRRRLAIEHAKPDGRKWVERRFGLMCDDIQAYRVVGVGTFTPVP